MVKLQPSKLVMWVRFPSPAFGDQAMRKLLASFMLLFVLGCNSVQRLQEQWLGRDRNVLIAVKGTPDQIMSDGFGGEIYSYFSYSSFYGTYGTWYPWHGHHYGHHYHHGHHWGYGYGYGFHYRDELTKTGETMFWLDPVGKVYRVSIAD
jgi:hypothetical protein